jgi:hypothetical protein
MADGGYFFTSAFYRNWQSRPAVGRAILRITNKMALAGERARAGKNSQRLLTAFNY